MGTAVLICVSLFQHHFSLDAFDQSSQLRRVIETMVQRDCRRENGSMTMSMSCSQPASHISSARAKRSVSRILPEYTSVFALPVFPVMSRPDDRATR